MALSNFMGSLIFMTVTQTSKRIDSLCGAIFAYRPLTAVNLSRSPPYAPPNNLPYVPVRIIPLNISIDRGRECL